MRYWLAGQVLALGLLVGCRTGVPEAIEIDPLNDACVQCRMIASDPRLAAEIVAPGTEPLIFDDIGCLRDYLAATPIAEDAVVYVADHRTGEWVRAEAASFTRMSPLATPMGSGIIAHADLASKNADPTARRGESVDVRSILSHGTAAKVSR